jgi:hypothetical protein
LTGDLAQPQIEKLLLNMLAQKAGLSVLGVQIGSLPSDESPWKATARFPNSSSTATLKTGLFPLRRDDALCILMEGAQLTSAAIGMSPAQRLALREKLLVMERDSS